MRTPDGRRLWDEYLRFEGNRQPCTRPGIVNQCAVRMSVALGRADCGFDFRSWTLGYVHNHAGACRELPPHVTNATNLTHYLRSLGLKFEIYPKSGHHALSASEVRERVLGRLGIIYFQFCFGAHGSHIDFWNGKEFMNQVLRVSAGGGLPHSSNLFATAHGEIWFLPTP